MQQLSAKKLATLESLHKEALVNAVVWNRQDGIYNNNYGNKHSDDTKQKIREKALARETHPRLGTTHTAATKELMRQKALGRTSPRKGVDPWNKGKKIGPQERIECTNCGSMFTRGAIARWHGVNCKHGV